MSYLIHWLVDCEITPRSTPDHFWVFGYRHEDDLPWDERTAFKFIQLDVGKAGGSKVYCRTLWAACSNGGDVEYILEQIAAQRPWMENRKRDDPGEVVYYDEAICVLVTLEPEKRPAVYHLASGKFVRVVEGKRS